MSTKQAIFASGCFWKPQFVFSQLEGVTKTRVGYCGGNIDNPSYRQVCTDTTGHAEVVLVEYDPDKLSYAELLKTFFSIHDPTTLNRQGPDIGSQYRSAIYYLDEEQKAEAEAFKAGLVEAQPGLRPIVTEITRAGTFYDAEEYHQDYYKKHGAVCS